MLIPLPSPLPPVAQPPASARLNKATANRQFFVIISLDHCSWNQCCLKPVSLNPAVRQIVARNIARNPAFLSNDLSSLQAAVSPICYSNQQLTMYLNSRHFVCAG